MDHDLCVHNPYTRVNGQGRIPMESIMLVIFTGVATPPRGEGYRAGQKDDPRVPRLGRHFGAHPRIGIRESNVNRDLCVHNPYARIKSQGRSPMESIMSVIFTGWRHHPQGEGHEPVKS